MTQVEPVPMQGVRLMRGVPPGPPGYPVVGSYLNFYRNPLKFYMDARAQFGDVVSFRGAVSPASLLRLRFNDTPRWLFIAHPDDIDRVLRINHETYTKGVLNEPFRLMLGEGLLSSEGELWQTQRQLLQPQFLHRKLPEYSQATVLAADQRRQAWEQKAHSGEVFDVAHEMCLLSLEIVGSILFGENFGDRLEAIDQALHVALEHVSYRAFGWFGISERIPTPRNQRFRAAIAVLDEVAASITAKRLKQDGLGADLLGLLLTEAQNGMPGGIKQVRDEIVTMLHAGQDTVASSLSWTWWLLMRHPDVELRLRDELANVLGGRLPTFEDLRKLPYLAMVYKESLRLYPPAWGGVREALKPDILGGYEISPGTPIVFAQYVTHRHPEFWDNPDAFDPERFSTERRVERHRFAYFPFGGGPHICIGEGLATMTALLVLATLLPRFTMRLAANARIEPLTLLDLIPRYGVPITLERRD